VPNHTRDTRQAFKSISVASRRTRGNLNGPEIPAANGNHACHQRSTRLSEGLSDGMRFFTIRMSHRMLLCACVGIAPLGELKRIASTNRILKAVFAPILLLPVSDHPFGLETHDARSTGLVSG